MSDGKKNESPNQLRARITAGSRRTTYKDGDFIFREGEAGDTAFVLLKGTVHISRSVEDKTIPIGVVNVGGIFGEMALIDDGNRMASALAVGNSTEALVVSRRVFEEKLDSADPFLRALISILTKRVRPVANK
jgi:CRP-like cAMP-binding protein